MQDILQYVFGSASFLPHGYCLLWRPDLVAMHGISDAAIALAYLAIPAGLIRFTRQRPQLPPEARRALVLFIAFMVACAMTHLVGLLTLWYPIYGLQGLTKALTAAISVVAAFAFWRMIPALAALPSPHTYRELNLKLQAEIASREEAYRELMRSRAALAQEVDDKTRDLRATQRLFEIANHEAPITVYEQDRDLRMRWILNPRVREDEAEVIGLTDYDLLPKELADRAVAVKRRVIETGRAEAYETMLPTGGSERLFRIHVTPMQDKDGEVEGIVAAAIDITDSRNLETRRDELTVELTTTLQRLNVALRASGLYVFTQNRDLQYLWVNAPNNPFGIAIGAVQDPDTASPEELQHIVLKRQVMESGVGERTELVLQQDDGKHWYSLLIEPKRDVNDNIIGVICAAMDITERREHEQQMRVVMRELSHRSKNLMAVVQAIARQTARHASDVDQFTHNFGQRVQAIAAAQDLLVASEWGETPLRRLIEAQLSPFKPEDASRVSIEGPDVPLSAVAVQALALTLHELATNAIKYGAFANDKGRVAIAWHVDPGGEDSQPMVHLTWQETDGPPVTEPTQRGFGRTVIERNTAAALDARIALDFQATGLAARFDIPLRKLSQ